MTPSAQKEILARRYGATRRLAGQVYDHATKHPLEAVSVFGADMRHHPLMRAVAALCPNVRLVGEPRSAPHV